MAKIYNLKKQTMEVWFNYWLGAYVKPEKLKKSFTVDNGKKFAAHEELAAGTGMKVFFCGSYSPWQRGTNENTNGLLRQFFPKGSSFDDVSDEKLQAVVDLINNRSRRRLGFRSPAELLLNFL